MYRRLTHTIDLPDPSAILNPAYKDQHTEEYVQIWGPWRLKGSLGIANNVFACCYLIVIWAFSFFPAAIPVSAATMNYSSLVFGATELFAILYYFLWGRRQYRGPVIEISL